MTGTDIIPIRSNESSVVVNYGKYIKRSRVCPICNRADHMEINLMRARDRLSYEEIVNRANVSLESLNIHFRSHFHISQNSRRMIELFEDQNQESNEIIERIMEGDVDFYSGAVAVLDSKAERLNPIKERIKTLTDNLETDSLDSFETQEFIQLNKLAEEIENSIMKIYQIVDKKLFPLRKEERENAVLAYKIKVLRKILDRFHIRLSEIENRPVYPTTNVEIIGELRNVLAQDFNNLEDEILQSGGVIRPSTNPTNNQQISSQQEQDDDLDDSNNDDL